MNNLSGRLKHRVEVWKRISDNTRNELGTKTYTDTKVFEVWAEIQPQTAKQINGAFAETKLQETTHKITIRHRNDISHDMWFKFRNERYDILYILNPNFTNDFLEIYCSVEVV